MKIFKKALTALAVLSASINIAHATVIESTATALGGSLWRYDYTVTNDTLAAPIEALTIFFDETKYRALSAGAGPAGWDIMVIDPDLGLPDAGLFDGLALSNAIGVGETLSGFSVVFEYLGGGTPGAQWFTILDPTSYAVLEDGYTQPTGSVPVPATGLLLIGAAGAMMLARRRQSAN